MNSNHGVEDAKYVGHFMAGRREGNGKLIWKCGSLFEGVWFSDQRQHGTMTFENGNKYVGGFYNDKLHGKARLHLSNTGTVFEGEFDQGFCPGVGTLLYSNGNEEEIPKPTFI